VISIKQFRGLTINDLEFLGSGTQGKVYRIDSQKCIKFFKKKRACRDELETLTMAQIDSHFPKVYESGKNYIVRECINGIELDKYLAQHPLTPNISMKILMLYEAMGKVGFARLDSAIFHILITPSGDLKLIDTAKAMKKKRICPKLILSGLETLGYKEQFINFVKVTRPELYNKWMSK